MKRKRLNAIQLVRALAILFIMIFHANFIFNEKYGFNIMNISNWGRSGGLDLFFIISGLMIYYINSKYIGDKSKVADFIKKRIFKIAPLYWFLTVVGFFLVFILPQLGEAQDRSISKLLQSIFFIHPDPIVGVAWSLRHIILFYFIFALLIALPNIAKIILPIWILTCLLHTLEIGIFKDFNSFLFSYNNVEIWLGVLMGYISGKISVNREKLILFTGVFLYLLIWINSSLSVFQVKGSVIIFLYSIAGSLIILGVLGIDLKKNIIINKKLSYLGDASYSIFLTHVQCIQFLTIVFEYLKVYDFLGFGLSLLLVISLTPMIGVLVYTIAEKPINEFLKNTFLNNKKQYKNISTHM